MKLHEIFRRTKMPLILLQCAEKFYERLLGYLDEDTRVDI